MQPKSNYPAVAIVLNIAGALLLALGLLSIAAWLDEHAPTDLAMIGACLLTAPVFFALACGLDKLSQCAAQLIHLGASIRLATDDDEEASK
jgi:hypothetical protein